jgi:hypothetical protein
MKQVLAIVLVIIGGSVAGCSEYQSARSQGTQNNPGAASQPANLTNNSAAQDKPPCTLTLAGAPQIKGLRLGMTPEQVLALFPGSEQDMDLRSEVSRPPSKFGVGGFVIRPDKYQSKEPFAGITQINLSLLDGRVSSFTAGYNGPEWPNVDKFVARFVEGTNLPAADAWEPYMGMETQLKTLKCADFEIRVFTGGPGGNLNYVLMNDFAAAKTLKDRRDKARATATPEPKPPK